MFFQPCSFWQCTKYKSSVLHSMILTPCYHPETNKSLCTLLQIKQVFIFIAGFLTHVNKAKTFCKFLIIFCLSIKKNPKNFTQIFLKNFSTLPKTFELWNSQEKYTPQFQHLLCSYVLNHHSIRARNIRIYQKLKSFVLISLFKILGKGNLRSTITI